MTPDWGWLMGSDVDDAVVEVITTAIVKYDWMEPKLQAKEILRALKAQGFFFAVEDQGSGGMW